MAKKQEELTPQQEYDQMWERILNDDAYACAISKICRTDFFSYIVTMYYLINCNKFMLKGFHEIVIQKLQDLVDGKNAKRNLALCLPVGCLTGDTSIRYNRCSLGRKILLKDLYEKFNGGGKRKWNLEKPTKVRSFNAKENRILLNEIEKVTYSGKQKVFKLVLEDGKEIKATHDHLFLTKEGFKPLQKMTFDDFVMVDNIKGKQPKAIKKTRKRRKEKTKCVGVYHPFSKTDDGYSWRVELHRAIYEANLNNLSLEEFCKTCKHPNNLKFINPKIYHIHHKDGNHENNAIDNLVCLTKQEHLKIHGNYKYFGYGIPEYSKVKSIEFVGEEDTYDIWVKDIHNFSANDIIVHNSGKSLITEYFISWCFARSRDNAFVYTSHSEDLITKMSAEIRNICTSPQWVRLFSWRLKKDDRQKTNFSFEGAKNRTGLRAKAINSAITGLDAGQPAVDGFSGALLIDDAMDAGNAIFEVERENVIRIYNEKLATRRRTSTTPTILIMQRLHPEDLVGWAERNQPELWDIVKVPALDENGNSFWEERYPAEELKMLQKKQPSLFQAQYQQDPIVSGGTIIHTDWFKYYDVHPKYDRIFIVADTAQKANEWNDYSVFQVWGKYANSLYMIDSIRGKWEIPELLQKAQSLTQKYRIWQNYRVLSALYIEDKGSGTGLIQQLRKACPTPILALRPKKKDKVTRMKDIVYYIESGYVYLPNDKNYGFIPAFLAECEMFSADGSAKHDDQCFVGDTLVATLRGDIPIRNVMEGDYVLTPFGAKRVLKAGVTGVKKVIHKGGLCATENHKIFYDGKFVELGSIENFDRSLCSEKEEAFVWDLAEQILGNKKKKHDRNYIEWLYKTIDETKEKRLNLLDKIKCAISILKFAYLDLIAFLKDKRSSYIKKLHGLLSVGVPKTEQPVYNLTVDEVGCFYANGILVSNCDCLAYAIEKGLAGEGSSIFD